MENLLLLLLLCIAGCSFVGSFHHFKTHVVDALLVLGSSSCSAPVEKNLEKIQDCPQTEFVTDVMTSPYVGSTRYHDSVWVSEIGNDTEQLSVPTHQSTLSSYFHQAHQHEVHRYPLHRVSSCLFGSCILRILLFLGIPTLSSSCQQCCHDYGIYSIVSSVSALLGGSSPSCGTEN